MATIRENLEMPGQTAPDRVHVPVQGHQHVEQMRAWAAGAACVADGDSCRVLIIADSIGELSGGYESVWDTMQALLVGTSRGSWWPPNANPKAGFGWPTLQGGRVDIGLDRRGLVMSKGHEAGIAEAQTASARPGAKIRIWYRARPVGGTVAVWIDGTRADTIDTSRDSAGDGVDVVTASQVWTSEDLDPNANHRFYLRCLTGSVEIEAAQWLPTRGVVVHGRGRSGISTAEQVHEGDAVAHLAAMVAIDEPPALVLLDTDTNNSETLDEHLEATASLVGQIRSLVPLVTIARKIPPWHGTSPTAKPHWPTWAEAFAVQNRRLGLASVDAFAALGDIRQGTNPFGFGSSDGVHFSARGQVAHNALLSDVLLSRLVCATSAQVIAQISQILDVAGPLVDRVAALEAAVEDLTRGS